MATKRIASLRVELNGYADADTATTVEGRVELGRYWVLEERTIGPSAFARLELSHFGGGDTWICTRWKTSAYADVYDAPAAEQRHDFSADPTAIDEKKLVDLFPSFDGFVYSPDDGQYPWALPGIGIRTAKKQNNCCTFVEALMVKAFNGTPGFSWNLLRHNQMMVNTPDLYGPVTAAVDSGVALPASSPDTPPQPWSIVQGWRSSGGGHTFFIVDHDSVSDRVLMLESNHYDEFKLNGPGYRAFGALEKFRPAAPPGWHLSGDSWTWAEVCSYYPKRLHAALRVKGCVMSGLPQV